MSNDRQFMEKLSDSTDVHFGAISCKRCLTDSQTINFWLECE